MSAEIRSRKLLSGSVLLCSLSLAGPLYAADWNGWYAGGSLGYGWGEADTKFDPLPTPALFVNLLPQTLTPKPQGALIGGQVGYNWQKGKTILGIEADLSWSDMDNKKKRSPFIQNTGASWNGTLTSEQEIEWLSTVRGRIGFTASDNWMIYGTGGVAWGRVQNKAISEFRPQGTNTYHASSTDTRTGWTLGIGAEWAMSPKTVVKFEYLYYDLGDQSDIGTTPNTAVFHVKNTWESKGNLIRAGLNFKF